MTFLARALLPLLLVTGATLSQGGVIGGGVSGLPQAPPPPGQPRDPRAVAEGKGTGVIKGRITSADAGLPVAKALVSLNGGARTRSVHTNDEGHYEFRDLAAGTYRILADPGYHRPGYQALPYGASAEAGAVSGRGQAIELAEGQRIENVDIALPRTSVITGRVLDALGNAVSRVQVGALIVRPGGEPSMTISVQSDDRGEFRLFGLSPGEYLVQATPSRMRPPTDVETEPTGLAPTYAPGTVNRAEAARIRLTRGVEVSADIRLVETRVFTISGTILNSKGETVRGGVSLMRADGGFGGEGNSMTGGGFVIQNVVPGDYDLIAFYVPPREPGSRPQGPDPDQEAVLLRVRVDHGDLTNVLLTTKPGARVKGEIVFGEALPDGRRANVSAQPGERRAVLPMPQVEVKGSEFILSRVFQPILLRGNVSASGWALESVRLRGRDVTDVPTAFTEADSGHLQVVFTAKAPVLEGIVTDDTGKPVDQASIVLFAQDEKAWHPRSSFFRIAGVEKEGRFATGALRAGDYFAVAVPPELTMNMGQPSARIFETLSKVATRVTLNAGDKRTLDLPLVRIEVK